MSRRWLWVAVALAAIVAALSWLFSVRLGGGSVYPEYSSLRADALGTRALYEALEQTPGFFVEREFRPLSSIGTQPRLIVIAGTDWRDWKSIPQEPLAALNSALQNGARVVIAFRPYHVVNHLIDEELERELQKRREKHQESDAEKKKNEKTKPDRRDEKQSKQRKRGAPPVMRDVAEAWGFRAETHQVVPTDLRAVLDLTTTEALPANLTWHSDLHFLPTADAGWRVLYRRLTRPVLMEKQIGRGTLVLLGDGFPLSNEALHRERSTALLAWLVGEHRRVVFVESHLGVAPDRGLGTLARRYGLGGAMALGALLAGLYAWRRVVPFYPLRDELERDGVVTLAHEPSAGMVSLLRRSLSPARVVAACVAEWRKHQRPGRIRAQAAQRFDAVWREHQGGQAPHAAYNALVEALKRR